MSRRDAIKWGTLRLRTLGFELPPNTRATSVRVTVNRKPLATQHAVTDRRVLITLAVDARISANQSIEAAII